MAKSFLDRSGITYEDYNVAEDKAARDEMIDRAGQMAVPVITINGDVLVGYDEVALREKLGLQSQA